MYVDDDQGFKSADIEVNGDLLQAVSGCVFTSVEAVIDMELAGAAGNTGGTTVVGDG